MIVNYYWIGNGGNWTNANHWSDTSGGSPGIGVPQFTMFQDPNVIFDTNSFSLPNQTVTVNNGILVQDFDSSTATNSPTLYFYHFDFSQIGNKFYGNVDFSGFGSITHNPFNSNNTHTLYFLDYNSNTKTITSGNCDIQIDLRFGAEYPNNPAYGTWIIQDNLKTSGDIYIWSGTFDTNNKNVSAESIQIIHLTGVLSTPPTILMGTGTWTCDKINLGSIVDITSVDTNLVFPYLGTASSREFLSSLNRTFNSLSITSGGTYTFQDSITITVPTFTANGSLGDLIILQSLNSGSTYTISSNSSTISYVSVSDCIASGTAIPFDDTLGGIDLGNNENWLFPAPTPDPPVADFMATPSSGSNPLNVIFTDLSANYPTSWAWDFKNDGTALSTAQHPSYTYTEIGTYSVKLVVTNDYGSDTIIKTNYVTSIDPIPPTPPYSEDRITFFAGADTDGKVQLIGVGHNDDDTPINYELETQDLEFGERAHVKTLQNKILILSQNANSSKIQISEDGKDYKELVIRLDDRVTLATAPNYKFHFLNFKWLGHTSNSSPILEGFYSERIIDTGING